jgi:hypothetical protein
MLQNPRELAAVIATQICVFAIEGVGHDPIRATGALLLDLPVGRPRDGGGTARCVPAAAPQPSGIGSQRAIQPNRTKAERESQGAP